VFLGENHTHEEILAMEGDQLPQAIPRDLRLRGNVIETRIKSIQISANIGDHIE
jgi:hypothetical protein